MDNPYQASLHTESAPSAGSASAGTIQALTATKPWVCFCSIIGFIGAGITISSGIVLSLGGTLPTMPAQGQQTFPGQHYFGILYIVFAVLYIIPALKLWKFGSAINRLKDSGANTDLQGALEHHRGFWKFVGIMVIVTFVLMVLAMVAAMVLAIATASSSGRP